MLKSVVVTVYAVRSKNEEFYFLPTQCFDVFFVDLRTNSDYFPLQH